MNAEMPREVFLYLFGATVCGGLIMFIVYRLLRRAPLWERVKALARAEEASTIVEFPFALIILIVFTVFAWQLAFMASAQLVVDYAAFVAVRSAAVVIPQDFSEKTSAENPNVLLAHRSVPASGVLATVGTELQKANNDLPDGFKAPAVNSLPVPTHSPKLNVVQGAAVMACYPIAGLLSSNNVSRENLASLVMSVLSSMPGFNSLPAGMFSGDGMLDKVGSLIGKDEGDTGATKESKKGLGRPAFLDFLNRFVYAYMNTTLVITPASSNYSSGVPITVEVLHDYQLAIPFARRVLGSDSNVHPDGWTRVRMLGVGRYRTMTGRATMLSEGYPEARPAGAAADRYPKKLPGGG